MSLVSCLTFDNSRKLPPIFVDRRGGDIIGLITEKAGYVWQVEEIQITFENRVVYSSLVSE